MNKNDKKALTIGCITLIAIPVIIIILLVGLFSLPIIVDNLACAAFEKDVIRNLNLPDGAAVIEYDRTCANLGGTGDHTELCVAIIIESDVPIDPDKVVTLADTFAYIEKAPEKLVGYNIRFKHNIPENGYVLIVARTAPMSSLDIRGC